MEDVPLRYSALAVVKTSFSSEVRRKKLVCVVQLVLLTSSLNSR